MGQLLFVALFGIYKHEACVMARFLTGSFFGDCEPLLGCVEGERIVSFQDHQPL